MEVRQSGGIDEAAGTRESRKRVIQIPLVQAASSVSVGAVAGVGSIFVAKIGSRVGGVFVLVSMAASA